MNENAVVLGYWLTQSQSLNELEEELKRLNQRLLDNSITPKIFYTDNCCKDRNAILKSFPSLTGEKVKLDPYHWINRYEIKLKHPLSGSFMRNLREALFVDSDADLDTTHQNLLTRGLTVPIEKS